MKKILMLTLTMAVLFVNTVSVMAYESKEQNLECNSIDNSRIVIQSDIICPACGAIGYPTGKISFASLKEEIVTRFLPIYQEMQCSADPSHIWYVYIADATQ